MKYSLSVARSELGMLNHSNGPLPPMNALRAFDAAARHESFSRAAEELGIQQPAVSRYVADLERRLEVRLFERRRRTVILTPAGEAYQQAVAVGLTRIATGAVSAANLADEQRVIVACGHATSHQFVMPRFDAVRRALDGNITLRILTADYELLDRLGEHEVDLVITYDGTKGPSEDRVVVFREAVTPVCSPNFAAAHAEVLARPVAEWGSLPFLRLSQHPRGWVDWQDWFESAGYPVPQPRYLGVEDYVYLLEAAVAGQGIALGWRHFIDRQIDAGVLVTIVDSFVEFDRSCFARLTERGRRRSVARRCLDAFGTLVGETASHPNAPNRPGREDGGPAPNAVRAS